MLVEALMKGLISSRMASIPMVASCVFRVTLTAGCQMVGRCHRHIAAGLVMHQHLAVEEATPDITSALLSTLAFPSTQSVCSPPVAMNTIRCPEDFVIPAK